MKHLTYMALAFIALAVSGCQTYKVRRVVVQGDSQAMEQLFKLNGDNQGDVDWEARLSAFKNRKEARIIKRPTIFVSLGEKDKEMTQTDKFELHFKKADSKSMTIDFDGETTVLVGRNDSGEYLYATTKEHGEDLLLPFNKWVPVGSYRREERGMMKIMAAGNAVHDYNETFCVTFLRATPNSWADSPYYSVP